MSKPIIVLIDEALMAIKEMIRISAEKQELIAEHIRLLEEQRALHREMRRRVISGELTEEDQFELLQYLVAKRGLPKKE